MFDSILGQVRLFEEQNDIVPNEMDAIAETAHEFINGLDILENACLLAFSPSVILDARFAENAETSQEQIEDTLVNLGEDAYDDPEFDDDDYDEDDDEEYDEDEDDEEGLEESTIINTGLTIVRDYLSEDAADIAADAVSDDEVDAVVIADPDDADSLFNIPGLLSDDDGEEIVDDGDSASKDYDDDGAYSF